MNNSLKLFEEKNVRSVWHDATQQWYFAVVDVVAILTESTDAKQYLKKLRSRDKLLNANWGTICTPLPLLAPDGRMRKTICANAEGILSIIQSIPSPKAEPDELERPKAFRPLRLVASGEALPQERVSAEALDVKLKLPLGWTAEHTGVLERRYAASTDTAAALGAKAAKVALAKAQYSLADIDAVVCASGGMQQSIPCTAALILEALKGQGTGIPCFDINATCLSFVVALDTLANALVLGRYRRILLVSTEITSRHLNWQDPESCCLFGDGAVAFVSASCRVYDKSTLH